MTPERSVGDLHGPGSWNIDFVDGLLELNEVLAENVEAAISLMLVLSPDSTCVDGGIGAVVRGLPAVEHRPELVRT